ncbi:hypothetical protein WN48_03078 [Eufriesea mexicana]|nr:hypothetical protein WN48_03078 [Eufriesea mexicana]
MVWVARAKRRRDRRPLYSSKQAQEFEIRYGVGWQSAEISNEKRGRKSGIGFPRNQRKRSS